MAHHPPVSSICRRMGFEQRRAEYLIGKIAIEVLPMAPSTKVHDDQRICVSVLDWNLFDCQTPHDPVQLSSQRFLLQGQLFKRSRR